MHIPQGKYICETIEWVFEYYYDCWLPNNVKYRRHLQTNSYDHTCGTVDVVCHQTDLGQITFLISINTDNIFSGKISRAHEPNVWSKSKATDC